MVIGKVLNRTGISFHPARQPNKSLPAVVFDMAFPGSDERKTHSVPGAAMALSTVLIKRGVAEPFFLSSPITEGKIPDFLKCLRGQQRPMVFALSLCDRLFEEIQQEVKKIGAEFPQAKVIIGGPTLNIARNLRDLATFFPEAAALVKGDGEIVIAELIRALCSDPVDMGILSEMKGTYVRDGWFEHQDERINVLTSEELGAQPGIEAFKELVEDIKRGKTLPLSTSRGCKYRCVFCSLKYHKYPIFWSADRIIQELSRIKKMIEDGVLPEEAKRIQFLDDDFFGDAYRAKDFLEKVIADSALRDFFVFYFTASVGSFFENSSLKIDLLDALARLRATILLGTDGFHPEALRAFRKGGYTWEMAKVLMEALFQRNIRQVHFIILTYPDITPEVLLETAENIAKKSHEYKSKFQVRLNPFLYAEEGNGLMGLPGEQRAIFSAEGKKWRLPYNLKFRDNELEKCLSEVLYLKIHHIPPPEEVEQMHTMADTPEKKERLKTFLEREVGFLKEGKTVIEALRSNMPFVNYAAVKFLYKFLKERLDQAG